MEPLISVIIPVYNVKDFLEKCVRSVVFQTYKNLEIILVDDGSTDGSGPLCDELASKYSRIVALHKENGGLSSARNYGMDAMHGDFFFFLDSDDYIMAKTIETLYNAIGLLHVDIVECGYLKVKSDVAFDNSRSLQFRKDTISEFIVSVAKWKDHFPMAWNKLYSTKVFGHLRFKVGRLNEDEFFVNDWILNVKDVGFVSNTLYCYRERVGSIMAAPYSLKRTDAIDAYVQRYELVRNRYPETKADLCFMIGNQVLNKTKLVASQGNDLDFKIRRRIVELVSPIIEEVIACAKFPTKDAKQLSLIKSDVNAYLKEVVK